MPAGQLVAIGTSAGGLDALRLVVGSLPPDFPAPVCVVMHTSPQSPGVLPEILARAGRMRVTTAENGARLTPGVVFVAAPDRHLIVEPGLVRTTRGPRENRFRPAIDPLFRSVAQVYGPAAIGVILTGNLDDGVAGLWTIKQLGGRTVVQDPQEAPFPSMPLAAMRHVAIDHVVRLDDLAPLLTEMVRMPVSAAAPRPVPEETRIEVDIAAEHEPLSIGVTGLGEPSPVSCPECHGVLLRLKMAGPLRFRCHTGHSYSAESLLAAIHEDAEATLWSALRSLHEGALLIDHLAAHVEEDSPLRRRELQRAAAEARRRAAEVQRLLVSDPALKSP